MSEDFKEEILDLVRNDSEFREKLKRELRDEGGEKNTEDKLLSRRGFLKKAAGGVAGLGAAAIVPSAAGLKISSRNGLKYFNRSSSDSNFEIDTKGNIDLKENNIQNAGKIAADEIDGNEVVADEVFANAVEMYVAGNGSDSNNGLSASEPKATIESAVKDAPIQGDQSSALKINVRGTIKLDVNTENWSISRVKISGEGNINDSSTTTLDAGNATGPHMLLLRGTTLVLENLHLANQDGEYVRVAKNGNAEVKSTVTLVNADDSPVFSNKTGSGLNLQCDATHNTDTRKGPFISIQDGPARIGGSLDQTGSNDHVLINIFDGNGRVDLTGSFKGLGSGTTSTLIRVQGQRHVKANNVPFEGANSIFSVGSAAEVIAQDGLSKLTDVKHEVGNIRGFGMYGSTDGVSTPNYGGLPVNSPNTGTNASDRKVKNRKGIIYYDQSREYFGGYIDDPHFDYHMLGIPTLDSEDTAEDMKPGEARVDTSVPELIIVDKGGNAYSVGLTQK